MINKTPKKVQNPIPTTFEKWYNQDKNIYVIRHGDAEDGTRYLDGMHSVLVATFESELHAIEVANNHNRGCLY